MTEQPAAATNVIADKIATAVTKGSNKTDITPEEAKDISKYVIPDLFELDKTFESQLASKVSELTGGEKTAGMSKEKEWPKDATTPRGPHAKCVLKNKNGEPEKFFFITETEPYFSFAK
eukprot:TRINITY_DN16998_c0_g1_i1.p2 TRINITY_DN16998_c0_g1~~TRINITY_DN16998_c0_g1_i1.p2  ORF type:complete len:119 (-),score=43.37 TRINITY_DN16998_c0_g1_i1:6-362(-)